jgi:tRNA/tmRNA/rRNA uracil-C5-methylase (TrmA/RlmC/RlmD family)
MAEFEVEVGAMAAGGGCVAKAPDGRVMFVRHAIPGERVRARVTQDAAHYLRADAVEVVVASPDRVVEPCPYAGPGRCGGCDWQHIALPRQRRLKAGLVAEQLRRVAGLDLSPVVEEVVPQPGSPLSSPGGMQEGPRLGDGLGWRTRARFAVDERGGAGFRRYRSHEVQPVTRCPIASAGVETVGVEQALWPGAKEVEVLALGRDALCQVTLAKGVRRFPGWELPDLRAGLVVDGWRLRGPGWVEARAVGRRFRVSAGSFWQVHELAPELLVQVVLDGLLPAPGEAVVDLFAGVGLFAAVLGERVGRVGSVLAVERDPRAYADAIANTSDLPQVRGMLASVTPELVATSLGTPDLVVLDPARSGAGPEVMAALASLRPPSRRIAYISCNPASFARDVRVLLDREWVLTDLRAFDLFPMTEHVELVGFLAPGPSLA